MVNATNITGSVIINTCPNTPANGVLYIGIALFMFILLISGLIFKKKFLCILSSLMFLVYSWYIVGCQGMVGYIFALIGLFFFVFSVVA